MTFVFENGEGPGSEGEITAFDPPSRLELRWGDERLRFELAPDGGGCVLTFVAPDTSGARWAEVHPRYVQRFGPAAATIAPPS